MMCTEVAIVSLLEHRRNGMKFEPILFQIEGAHIVFLKILTLFSLTLAFHSAYLKTTRSLNRCMEAFQIQSSDLPKH